MSQERKAKPSLIPRESRSLPETLRFADEDPAARKEVRVHLRVEGGLPSRAYTFELEASGKGTAKCQLNCLLTGRKARPKSARMDDSRFVALLRKIRESKVLSLPAQEPRFLPDTVVGCLTISDGESTYRTWFAANEPQARVQDKLPPAPLRKALDAVYGLGSEIVGMKSVKP